MEKMVRSGEHQQRGRKRKRLLSFRLELAKQLIGSFSTRGRSAGRPRSVEHLQLDRLNVNLGHWPKLADKKGNCVVCLAVVNKKNNFLLLGTAMSLIFNVNTAKYPYVFHLKETVSRSITLL